MNEYVTITKAFCWILKTKKKMPFQCLVCNSKKNQKDCMYCYLFQDYIQIYFNNLKKLQNEGKTKLIKQYLQKIQKIYDMRFK